MKTAYIVTAGQYSSYGILAVFLDKEKAQKFVNEYNGEKYNWSKAGIEKWPLDPKIQYTPVGKVAYSVWMDIDGNNAYANEISFLEVFDKVRRCKNKPKDRVYMNVFAKNKTHAIKILNEKRTQLIAENIKQ
jgi:hypothetical protein